MLKYERILAATDFSPVSEIAAREAIELTKHYGSELVFLHVVEHFPEHLPHYRIAHEDMDPEHFITDRAEKDLAALCEQLERPDAERHVRLTTHSAKAEIVRFSIDHDIDLIVIGSHGSSHAGEVLLGSVNQYVLHHAPCPVLTVRRHV